MEANRHARERLSHMLEAMRERGLRLTPQRLAILKILAESENHPSVEAVHQLILRDFPTTSLATVYKTVSLLKQMGQVLELAFADAGSRYDGAKPFPHPHVICTKCGAIADPEFSSMAEMAKEMADKSGYRITTHRLDFFGLCPNCRGKG